VHSFSNQPFGNHDLDAPNYKGIGALNGPGGQQMRDDVGASLSGSGIKGSGTKAQSGKKEAIDRFATLIDTEAPRFVK